MAGVRAVDGDIVASVVSEEVARQVALLPPPEPGPAGPPGPIGERGLPGQDGVSLAGAFINHKGCLVLTTSAGTTVELGEVVGKDADLAEMARQIREEVAKIPPPKDGQDGVGMEDMTLERTGDRDYVLRFVRGDRVKEFPFTIDAMIYQGIFEQGREYRKGDTVTYAGSLWFARADTSAVPGAGETPWQLAAKRGRDGRDGKNGERGPVGPQGRPGRDLTQMGPDGAKW